MDYQTIVTNVKNGVIQTPAYIFDIDILREKVAGICEILGGTAQMCYAIKANPFLLNAFNTIACNYPKQASMRGRLMVYNTSYTTPKTASTPPSAGSEA